MFTLLTTWMSLFVKYKWNKKLEPTEESVSRVMHIVYKLIILSLVYVVGSLVPRPSHPSVCCLQ